MISLKENERSDDLQRNNYKIIQDPDRFCFGMDAVLLSGFAKAKEGDKVLDLGTGTGIIPILMAAKTMAEHITGLEIQPDSADMAARSVRLNGLEDKIRIVTGDIKEAVSLFGAASFDVVTCNPPYMTEHHGLTNPEAPKAIARHELLCTLEDVISQSSRLLRPGGNFYLVHRPFRLADIILRLRQYRLEPKRLQMVHPFADK
ncbi:MAG: tRNA1(Val) (adenine(37)-N6)-methyltransferase, partial [Lachnospiraceae bacterium]|nr:tRNA1(Val) (adenine(37)-N6)-methyltransferase [Lachnospiraceae bacterium]